MSPKLVSKSIAEQKFYLGVQKILTKYCRQSFLAGVRQGVARERAKGLIKR